MAAAVFEDLAGSPRLVNASQIRRDPFGVELEGDDSLMSRGVSGGEQEVTGETYLGWRLYDAEVGRFLQADRLSSASAGMGQGLNRYRYGWNSPTNFTDPSGYSEVVNAVAPMGRMAGWAGPTTDPQPWRGPAGEVRDGASVRWGCAFGMCFVEGGAGGLTPKQEQEVDFEVWMETCRGGGSSTVECVYEWLSRRFGSSTDDDSATSSSSPGWAVEAADALEGLAVSEYKVAENLVDDWNRRGLTDAHPHMQGHLDNGDLLLNMAEALRGDKAASKELAKELVKRALKTAIGRGAGRALGRAGSIPKTRRGRGTVPPSERDKKRNFPRKKKADRLGANGGRCEQCQEPLDLDDAKGHHIDRHADGGLTEEKNLAVLCEECHNEVHRP